MSTARRLDIGQAVRWHGAPGYDCRVLEINDRMVRISYLVLVPEGRCGHCGGDGKWIDVHTGHWGGFACPECRGSGYRPLHEEVVTRWVRVDELSAVELEAVS